MLFTRRHFLAAPSVALALDPGATLADAADAAEASGWVLFERGDGGIIIQVTINGVLTRAILDNAASRTLVSAELATRAKLPMANATGLTVRSWGEPRQAVMAGPTTVALGRLSKSVQPIVLPFGTAGPPQPLLFGQDALRGSILQVDPNRRMLRLLPRRPFKAPADFVLVSIPMEVKADQESPVNIPMRLEGHEVSASLDLGSDLALHISKPLAERFGLLKNRLVSNALSGSVGGFSTSPALSVKTASLAGHEFSDVPAEVFLAPKETAVLGLNLMERFYLLLDGEAGKLWLKPIVDALDVPFRKDLTGLALVPAGQTLKVMLVSAGSPAERAGWRVGEEVSTVDEVSAPALKGRRWKEGPPGAIHRFIMADGTKRSLVLAPYY